MNKFLRTSEKNPEHAKEMVLAAINKLPPDKQNTPEVIAFKTAVSRSRDLPGLSNAFSDHSEVIDEMEKSTKGIRKL